MGLMIDDDRSKSQHRCCVLYYTHRYMDAFLVCGARSIRCSMGLPCLSSWVVVYTIHMYIQMACKERENERVLYLPSQLGDDGATPSSSRPIGWRRRLSHIPPFALLLAPLLAAVYLASCCILLHIFVLICINIVPLSQHSIRNMGVPRYVAYTEWSRPADIVIRSGITILFPSTLNVFVIFLAVFLCVLTIQAKVCVCYCGFVLFYFWW